IFEGPHEWAPPEVFDQALAWFRLEAMRANLEPRQEEWIAARLAEDRKRAEGVEGAGDLLPALRQYRQIVHTFAALADVSRDRTRMEALASDKRVRDERKREQNAFDEQSRLSSEVLAAVADDRTAPSAASPSRSSAASLARELLERSR